MSDYPTLNEVVLSKDITPDMIDYFNRAHIKLEITSIDDKKYTASVGTCYNNVVFCGKDVQHKDNYSIQLRLMKSIKIIS